jgi:hypothetical protein
MSGKERAFLATLSSSTVIRAWSSVMKRSWSASISSSLSRKRA